MSSKTIDLHYHQASEADIAEIRAWATSTSAVQANRIVRSELTRLKLEIAEFEMEGKERHDLLEKAKGLAAFLNVLDFLTDAPTDQFQMIDEVRY